MKMKIKAFENKENLVESLFGQLLADVEAEHVNAHASQRHVPPICQEQFLLGRRRGQHGATPTTPPCRHCRCAGDASATRFALLLKMDQMRSLFVFSSWQACCNKLWNNLAPVQGARHRGLAALPGRTTAECCACAVGIAD